MKANCDFCKKDFKKGHLCWCEFCSKPHPMCNPCYREGMKNGTIVDKVVKRNNITDKNKERYT